jgi:hypothetical protein
MREIKTAYKTLVEIPKKRNNFGDSDKGGRIILKSASKLCSVRVWTGLI